MDSIAENIAIGHFVDARDEDLNGPGQAPRERPPSPSAWNAYWTTCRVFLRHGVVSSFVLPVDSPVEYVVCEEFTLEMED